MCVCACIPLNLHTGRHFRTQQQHSKVSQAYPPLSQWWFDLLRTFGLKELHIPEVEPTSAQQKPLSLRKGTCNNNYKCKSQIPEFFGDLKPLKAYIIIIMVKTVFPVLILHDYLYPLTDGIISTLGRELLAIFLPWYKRKRWSHFFMRGSYYVAKYEVHGSSLHTCKTKCSLTETAFLISIIYYIIYCIHQVQQPQ